MEKEDRDYEIIGISVASTDGFEFLDSAVHPFGTGIVSFLDFDAVTFILLLEERFEEIKNGKLISTRNNYLSSPHKSCPQYERLKLLLHIGKSEMS